MSKKKFLVEIRPKKNEFDPLAHRVRNDLLETGELPASAIVHTEHLYRIEAEVTSKKMEEITEALLLDPVIQTAVVTEEANEKTKKKGKAGGWVVDVWPKPGVTDPVGETVIKGIRDLGFQDELTAMSATRYIFPKIEKVNFIKSFAAQHLANKLIHDIDIRENN